MEEQNRPNVETHDLGLATALFSSGCTLIALERLNPKKAKFVFANVRGIEAKINDYWSDHLRLNARTLFDNQKMLKNRLYSTV